MAFQQEVPDFFVKPPKTEEVPDFFVKSPKPTQEQPREEQPREEPSFWDRISTPLVEIGTHPAFEEFRKEHPVIGGIGKIGTGIISSMTSPLSLSLMGGEGLAVAANLARLGRGVNLATRALGAGTAGHGLYKAYEGETLPEKIGGGVEAALGGLGALSKYRPAEIPVKYGEVVPSEPLISGTA